MKSLYLLLALLLTPLLDAESTSACREMNTPGLSWFSPTASRDRLKLDSWCETVGPPLFRTGGSHSSRAGRILVINWNVNVGNGNLEELIGELSASERRSGRDEPHFVFLLQEAFRRRGVPETVRPGAPVPGRIQAGRDDIERIAEKLDWSLFYVPSMRNGKETGSAAQDRGNAILSSLSLDRPEAIELPISVQRRVAASAFVHDPERSLRFRVVAVHLDTRAPLSQGSFFGAAGARNHQAKGLTDAVSVEKSGQALIVAGDLNTYWGGWESSIDTLAQLAPRVDCGSRATHVTGFTLDHLFARFSDPETSISCRRAERRFGSDHYPLVLAIGR
jgi:endonuclease/exonuclease/phosphatase family metal-dependent hydrolase